MSTSPASNAPNKQRLMILGGILLIGLALVAWRLLSSSGDGTPDAATAAEQALQEQIQREGLDAPAEDAAPEEPPVTTRGATKLDGE